MSDEEFGQIVDQAVAKIPSPYKERVQNIAFLVEDDPTPEQRQVLRLRSDQTLFGLYEGTPLPQRGGMTKILPDKITLFKNPLLAGDTSAAAVRDKVAKTIWHEVAHYFGLDHQRIHQLENKDIK